VDSNVARFLSRLAGIHFSAESRRKPLTIHYANLFMHVKRSFELNLAILDFSAAVCRAKKPLCDDCVLKTNCAYRNN